jgi:hypothetical protein
LEHLQQKEAAEIEEEKQRRAEYEEEMQAWKDSKDKGEKPEEPEPATRLLISDITTEGLLSVHARAPKGLLLTRDELGGWLKGFNQYKGGKGSDTQTWTEVHQGKPCIIDRKGAGTLSIPRAAVSIVGGVQPELLREALSGEHLYDGLASRVLFVVPPEEPKQWNEETVSAETREGWNCLLDKLLELKTNDNGTPKDLPLTAKAKAAWVRYYNEHAEREDEEEGSLRSAMSKLEATTARVALVIQLANDPESVEIDVEAIEGGIIISDWFEGQARQVYKLFEASEQEKDRREACDWIAKRGGKITKRDFSRCAPSRFRSRAVEVLNDLVTAGLAKASPKTGNRSEEYVLCNAP